MGVVYRATQLALDRTVALKLIAPALSEDHAFRQRFMRESKVAASIDHPNVDPGLLRGRGGRRRVHRDALRRGRRPAHARAPRAARCAPSAPRAIVAPGRRRRSTPRTPPASSTATSSPPTSCSAADDHAYLTDFGLTKHALSAPARHAAGPLGRHARLRRARADPRRADRRARGRLRARLRALLRAHRPAAVRARHRRGDAVGAPVRAAAAPSERGAGAARRVRRGVARALAKEPGRSLPVGRRPRPRALAAAARRRGPASANASSRPAPPRRSRSRRARRYAARPCRSARLRVPQRPASRSRPRPGAGDSARSPARSRRRSC